MVPLAEVFYHKSWVDLISRVDRVQNVIIQHQIFIILEASDFFLLPYAVDDFLILGEHVVKHDLLPQNVDDLIVIDALRTADVRILIESKSFLER
jgi:hypothetical protein